jgi:hypothetical protein
MTARQRKATARWPEGSRVRVTISGRTGTIERTRPRNTGEAVAITVRWDEPVFGVETSTHDNPSFNFERLTDPEPFDDPHYTAERLERQ